jgi:hypothetical protein
MFFYVWFLIPETKGLSLESMDELFGVTEAPRHIELETLNKASSVTSGQIQRDSVKDKEIKATTN